MLTGDEDLGNKKIIFATSTIVGALVISVMLNLHYYVNLRRENESVLHNMRAWALASYGSEAVTAAYFLEEYLETLDLDIIDEEVAWGIFRAELEADICTQGLSEDSGLMYYELRRTTHVLENYFVWGDKTFNTTKVETIAQSLRVIGYAFAGFDLLTNKDPLEELSPSGVDTVNNYCRKIQETVS
jgi:hypothetical protein